MDTEPPTDPTSFFLLTEDPFCDGPVRTYYSPEEVPDVLRPYTETTIVGSTMSGGPIYEFRIPERIAKVLQ